MHQLLRSTRAILPLIFSAALACTLNANAESGQDTTSAPSMKCGVEANGGSLHNDQGKRCGPIAELNLNDSQRTAFRQAMKQMHQAMEGARKTHEALGDLVNSDSYDENKAHEIFRKNSADMENNVVAASTLMHNFYLSLSTEQKTKFNQMRIQMRERMRHHAEERRHPHSDSDSDDNMPSSDDK